MPNVAPQTVLTFWYICRQLKKGSKQAESAASPGLAVPESAAESEAADPPPVHPPNTGDARGATELPEVEDLREGSGHSIGGSVEPPQQTPGFSSIIEATAPSSTSDRDPVGRFDNLFDSASRSLIDNQ